LHVCPQFYKVDDVNTALNPTGLFGRKLEIQTLLIVAQNTFLRNLTKAVNQSGYEVAHLYFTSFAAANTSLSEQQRRHGCVLVDMGAEITEVLIFRDGQLKYFSNVPLGGEQVTRGIAQELNVAFDLAEDIKRSYAFVPGEENRNNEEILVKREEGYLPVKKERISRAIEPVVARWLELVGEKIKISGYQEQLNTGMLIVGGNALLPGLPERMEKQLGLPVKLGEIDIANKRLQNAAKYAAAVGLAVLGTTHSGDTVLSRDGQKVKGQNFFQKVADLYQEYF
jgi:cell division protein FtsA